MRKSRQQRCTAAISRIAAVKAPKPLEADRNPDWADLCASSPAQHGRSCKCPGWHQVKQNVPDAW